MEGPLTENSARNVGVSVVFEAEISFLGHAG